MNTLTLSIVIPCRDEVKHIRKTLDSVLNQTFDLNEMEIFVVDGLSTDGTVKTLNEYAYQTPQLRILQNERIITASARNIGIHASRGEFIAMVDAHCEISPTYLATCCQVLSESSADLVCIAGRTRAFGETNKGKIIALAMSSPFGVGNALFRWAEAEVDCSSAAFGVYRRSIFDKVGFYDEKMMYAEDDELSFRIRQAGFRIRMLPHISAKYWMRDTYQALWKQYYRYGQGKVLVLRKHRKLPSWRVLIAPIFVLTFLLTLIGGLFTTVFSYLWLGVVMTYLIVGLIAGCSKVKGEPLSSIAMVQAFFCIHTAYGAGFLTGLLKQINLRRLIWK
jgi:cellulose synthase/poly-beta-1,6-N-acetylglucosamine synthase-like glycosyltransferase